MICDRCKKYHLRTFKCYNEESKKEEIICGSCIIEIWGIGKMDISDFHDRMEKVLKPTEES